LDNEIGQGIPKDEYEAMKWYQKAANAGDAKAQLELGELYHTREDYQDAFKWFHKSAIQGDIFAMEKIGHAYEVGMSYNTSYLLGRSQCFYLLK
jgi:TPR repeat protein